MKIVIAHKKGGVGKTTIAQCLCAYMQNNSIEFVAVDMDSQRQLKEFADKRKKHFDVIEMNSKDDLSQINGFNGHIVFDMGGYDSTLSRAILSEADVIIVPLSKSANDFDGLTKFIDVMEHTAQNAKVLIVLNRIHHSDRKTHQDLKNALKESRYKVLESIIPSSAIFESQLDTGITPLDKNTLSGIGAKVERFCIEALKEMK